MKDYKLGELMSDADSLAHYGVAGMKWGKTRAKGSSYDIKEARSRLGVKQQKLASQRKEVRKTHKTKKPAAKAKYEEMKTDFLKDPDRVLASRLTRGEKVVAALLITPVGSAAIISGTSASSRRIEQKQETGQYDK